MSNNSNNNVPPPPQAGKFKPRKPAKVTNRVVVPENVPSTHVPPQPQQRTSSTAGRGRGHHGPRGTRGSRPNTTTPIVQGQAFFTAPPLVGRGRLHNNNNMAPLAVTSNAAAATTTTVQTQQRPSRRKRDDPHDQTGGDEEIVGTLDEAVGYNTLNISSSSQQNRSEFHPSSAVASDPKKADFERVLGKLTSPTTYHGPNGTIYDDSDSSDDENSNNKNHQMDDIIVETRHLGVPRPLTLPHHHPIATAPVDTTTTTTNPDTTTTTDRTPVCQQFPFWNTKDHAYCLVQLPTRLPPVKIAGGPAVLSPPAPADSEVRIVDAPVVTTPSIASPQAFDHEVLLQAPPGRMGTLKLYRSGRTVLVLEPPNNTDAEENHDTAPTRGDPVVLNVSEGLRCEFQQQAVSINLDQQTYTPFGRVYGTMVMTPDF